LFEEYKLGVVRINRKNIQTLSCLIKNYKFDCRFVKKRNKELSLNFIDRYKSQYINKTKVY